MRKHYFQNKLSLCGGTDRLQHLPSSYAFSINWIFHLAHPSCSCSYGSMGQSCCHCEYQKGDLDGLYHPQLTNWSTFTGQMRNSSRAAAVMNNTCGYECWIAKLSLHIQYENKETQIQLFPLNIIQFKYKEVVITTKREILNFRDMFFSCMSLISPTLKK